jgi:23S rRNA (pseudouridine1915-N3)-methyltransferase
MIKINVLAVGKVKEKYFLDGINEYKKRLSRFSEFNIVEIEEENFKNPTPSEIEIIKEKEAQKILPHIKGKTIVMAIEGKKISSETLASLILGYQNLSSTITFIIGGSYGLSEKVKNKADIKLSFSDMTFPHTLFRLMLTEQIYRAFTIINGVSYHK